MAERVLTKGQRKRALELAREYEHCASGGLAGHMEVVSVFALEQVARAAALQSALEEARGRLQSVIFSFTGASAAASRAAIEAYQCSIKELRALLTDPDGANITEADLERLAPLPGALPDDPGER